ncbi:hypothetical protein [Pseudomonas citrulli]|uniref:Uncharacterized protein n=1 Tax=Pseudomonas citrulli TaxID=3064347 RepID=A0ABT9C194_9PSED|nr:hypothetical protein [Pseudomonas sp. K18]MDO7898580.1 hypothetical protein [Pseudomonas sp. K18]
MEAHSSATRILTAFDAIIIGVCLLVNLAWIKAEKSQKRAESSSFAKGRLGPKAAPTVTNMTHDHSMVIFRVKIQNTL